MSTSSDLVAVMQTIDKYLYQIACPILMLIGTVGSLMNLMIFMQKNLRKNPCSIYFIAYNIANLLYIYSSLLSLTLGVGFNIDPSSQSLILCRLRLYIVVLFNVLSPFYLILAFIDRILVTSRNALIRQRSTRRLAYISIASGTLFWTIFHSHALIFSTITEIGPNIFLCSSQQGFYTAFVGYYSIIKEILALSAMIICGLWAIKNVQQITRIRVAPELSISRPTVDGGSYSSASKDRQLLIMLRVDVGIYAFFSFVFAIFLMYQQVTQNYTKSFAQIQLENVVRFLCLFSISIPFCISCYANFIMSRTFRKELKKIFF